MNLSTISIPDSIERIGECTFSGCVSLTQIKLPKNLKIIGDGCFSGCSGLTEISIPANVTYLGMEVVKGCTNLNSVVFEETEGWQTIGYDDTGDWISVGIGESVLTNPTAAANYLKDYYNNNYYPWERTE